MNMSFWLSQRGSRLRGALLYRLPLVSTVLYAYLGHPLAGWAALALWLSALSDWLVPDDETTAPYAGQLQSLACVVVCLVASVFGLACLMLLPWPAQPRPLPFACLVAIGGVMGGALVLNLIVLWHEVAWRLARLRVHRVTPR